MALTNVYSMTKFNRAIISSLLGLLTIANLTGCSTFSKQQCLEMDWKAQGFSTANNGESLTEGIAYFNQECGREHSIRVDSQLFKLGYDQGLKEFCSPENAFASGNKGVVYKGTCAQYSEDKFLSKYLAGRAAFTERRVVELESKVDDLESQVSNLKSEVSDKESQIRTLEGQLRSCP